MTTVEVLVRLTGTDPWSFTVFDTLKRKFSLGELVAVTRMKSWQLSFGLENAEDALDVVARLLRDTALLANPNKEVWSIRGARQDSAGRNFWRKSPGSADAFVVKVTDIDDIIGKSLVKVLRGRLGIREIADARFSSVWVLELSEGGPRSSAVAGDVAVSRSWRRGLLSNPHFQGAEIFKAEEYLPPSEDMV